MEPVRVSIREFAFKNDILSFYVTELLQTRYERVKWPEARIGIVGAAWRQDADPRYLF